MMLWTASQKEILWNLLPEAKHWSNDKGNLFGWCLVFAVLGKCVCSWVFTTRICRDNGGLGSMTGDWKLDLCAMELISRKKDPWGVTELLVLKAVIFFAAETPSMFILSMWLRMGYKTLDRLPREVTFLSVFAPKAEATTTELMLAVPIHLKNT